MNKRRLRVLKDIQDSVPKEWRDALMTEQLVAPDVRQAVIDELASRDEMLAKAKGVEYTTLEKHFNRLQNVFDAGYYDATELVVNEEIAKKIEDHVSAGIQAAIDDGRLSDNDEDLAKYVKKIRKNVRKKQVPSEIFALSKAEKNGALEAVANGLQQLIWQAEYFKKQLDELPPLPDDATIEQKQARAKLRVQLDGMEKKIEDQTVFYNFCKSTI